MQTQTQNENASKENARMAPGNEASNLQSLIIVGKCRGIFVGEVERRFTGNHVLVVKHDGTVLLHSASKGILPVCYVSEASTVSIDREVFDAELEVNAKNAKGERIQAIFRKVYSMAGVPERRVPNVVKAVLECVADLDGKLGRKKIAGILTGSCSKLVLGMGAERLRPFGKIYGRSRKEVVRVIDELLVQGYLAVLVDSEYPTLSITAKGRAVLESGAFDGAGFLAALSTDAWPVISEHEREALRHLRKWRHDQARERDVPPYFILDDKSILELAVKKPGTMDELQMVRGIGQRKAESYGPQLLYLLGWLGDQAQAQRAA